MLWFLSNLKPSKFQKLSQTNQIHCQIGRNNNNFKI
uniref:Uncharacterized protein n=1 Tax=Rhizophora mucronata TaxID=61149 RepID=A0A2P2NKF3_RHIMU